MMVKKTTALAVVAAVIAVLSNGCAANAQMQSPPSCVDGEVQQKARIAFGEMMVSQLNAGGSQGFEA